jgi:hypothetical protein
VTTASVTDKTTYPVVSISGEEIRLQTDSEVRYYELAKDRYLSDNKFTHASDMRSLDRLIFFETMVYRWQTQLASGKDYQANFLSDKEEEQLRKNLKETAITISQVQNDLGLTKAQRDKDQHDSVGAYLQQLQLAAKEHGIRREKQLGKALELSKELFSLVGAFRRSNEVEREKLGLETPDQILDWIEEYMKPEFDAVDEHFRKNQQRFWLRKI